MTSIGRFAPSPTGPLHVGNAFAAYVAWRRARGGEFLLRIEDLDAPRVVAGSEVEHIADLRWLGIDWTEGPLRQSERLALYAQAVEELLLTDRAYYCTCSRKQLQLASAPHGPEGPRYPGTCRGQQRRPKGQYAVRLQVDSRVVSFADAIYGEQSQNVAETVGDFVISRADGVFAYQLAVVVDDADMGVTEVVRGCDLLTSTPRQLLVYEALGKTPPSFAHLPLMTADGEKLSKRNPRHTVSGLRALAVRPEALQGRFDELWAETLAASVRPREIDIGTGIDRGHRSND